MTKELSNSIVSWLIKNGVISAEAKDVYSYAAFNLLHTCIPLIITVWIGFLMNSIMESLFLILPFIILRKYSGGFHLSTPFRCMIASVTVLTLFLTLIKTTELSFILFCFFIVAQLLLLLFSPVDPKSRKLTSHEISYCTHRVKQSVLIIDLLCLILFMINNSVILLSLIYGVILCEILQLPVIISNTVRKNK